MIHTAIIAVFSSDPKELSLLYVLNYVRCAGGMMTLVDVKNGAQQDRILGSAHQVSLTMADSLGDMVLLEHPVIAIDQSLDDTMVKIKCDNQSVFSARRVIMTVPPYLAGRIDYLPPLPYPRVHLTQRMAMGQVIKFIVHYDTCFWRELGFAGEIVSDRESVAVAYDGSFEDGTKPSIIGFFEGNSAREWGDKTEEERKKEVLDLLFCSFGDERALHPTMYMEKNWMAEKYSLGGYTGICGPGVLTSLGNALRQPIGRIHFAGTETATQWIGYMEGALQSAERWSSI
eukprot:gene12361-14501_t